MAELVPEVVDAARDHFGSYTNGLFSDPRVQVVIEDGRNLLFASSERYDVIVADLFLPWAAGARGIYSREHFETVRSGGFRVTGSGENSSSWSTMHTGV